MDFFVRIDYVNKFNVVPWVNTSDLLASYHRYHFAAGMDLAHTVNRAHDELIQVPTEHQVRLQAQSHQHNVPDELSAFLTDF